MTYALASWFFLRLLGLIYLSAFLSLVVQIKGLVGEQGILPAREFLAGHRYRPRRFWRLPTLCWLSQSDRFLVGLSWGGAVLSVLLIVDFAALPILVLLWIVYLSLFVVCRIFLGYQWDILLLETGFLAVFLAPADLLPHFPPERAPSVAAVWLSWWLLFRLMLSSGFVKVRSGDASWRKLTALAHHYETQPLPTPLAWYAHQLPLGFHKLSTLIMFGIELLAPFLIFGPAPLRHTAALLFILLMILIQFTGNYCFFNLLGIALSLMLFDDQFLGTLFHSVVPSAFFPDHFAPASPLQNRLGVGVAALILILSPVPVLRLFRLEVQWPNGIAVIYDFLERFRLVNSYGLFSLMTVERPEIILEGSDDGVNWKTYRFRYKPGNPTCAPRFVAPHQPRLDWQMWFAALGHYENHRWFTRFLVRLLEGSPAVSSLLAENPFLTKPPRYVRGVLYNYRFTNVATRRLQKTWWEREERGLYCQPVKLGDRLATEEPQD